MLFRHRDREEEIILSIKMMTAQLNESHNPFSIAAAFVFMLNVISSVKANYVHIIRFILHVAENVPHS